MNRPARAWIPLTSIVTLVVACEQPSTELGSTRAVWTWVSDASDAILAVASTPDDGVVVILSQPSGDSSALRKHHPDGTVAWTRPIARAIDVVVDAQGTIVVLGDQGDDEWSLLAHAPDGSPLWTAPLPVGVQATALGVLGDRTLVVATNVDAQAEVRAYLPSGAPSWIEPLHDDLDAPFVATLATSPSGHIIAGGTLATGGTWLARLSASGQVAWAQSSGGDRIDALAIDHDGASFVVGALDRALWLRRLAPAGALEWEQVDPAGPPREGNGAAIHDDGTLYWVGHDYANAVVVALEPDGTERWQELVTGPAALGGADLDEDSAAGVALGPNGDVIAAGGLDYRSRGTSDTWFRGWLGRYAADE